MFEWKNEYDLNIEEIDKQHKKLFSLAGEIYELAKAKDSFDRYDDIMKILQELSDYTVYHFGYEEQLLDRYNFDSHEAKMHKLEHGAFVNKIQKLSRQDIDKNQKKVLLDVMMFAVDWIEKHILNTDKKYSAFINSHGVY